MGKRTLTLGSLFDGSGGFPLAGILCGIEPIWASEVEPFAVRVTTKRLPYMKHYGDVSVLSGAELPPVDIITFGSPCQDMSVAGKRVGLDGKRSGLFHEAIRIITEMREKTNGEYPRYCVWENVPGAFSSNNGEDFKTVLEAVIGVKEPACEVPAPGKNGWPYADVYLGDGWSVAYRLLDAQFWGVPQRRARIFLVADFGGERAGDILFKSEGLSGYSAEGFEAWKRAARDPETGAGETGGPALCLNPQSSSGVSLPVAFGISSDQSHAMLSGNPHAGIYEAETARTLDAQCGHPGCNQGGIAVVEKAYPLEGNGLRPSHRGDGWSESEAMYTLNATEQHGVAAPVYHGTKNSHLTHFTDEPALDTLVATEYKEPPVVAAEPYYIVRRLTPTECARLQGFPDWWCKGLGTPEPTEEEITFWTDVFETYRRVITKANKPKTRKQIVKWLQDPYLDSAAYRLWGNGVAFPCVWFVLAGIEYYDMRDRQDGNQETEEI